MSPIAFIASAFFLVIGLGVGFYAGSASNMARMQAETAETSQTPGPRLELGQTQEEKKIINFLATFADLDEEPTLAEIHHRFGWKGIEVAAQLAQTEEGQL